MQSSWTNQFGQNFVVLLYETKLFWSSWSDQVDWIKLIRSSWLDQVDQISWIRPKEWDQVVDIRLLYIINFEAHLQVKLIYKFINRKNHLQVKVSLDKVDQIKLFKSSWLEHIIQFY